MSFFFDTAQTDAPNMPPPEGASGAPSPDFSSFMFDTSNAEPQIPTEVSTGPRTGFFENLGASFDSAVTGQNTTSQAVNEARARAERVAAIEKVSGKSFSATIEPFRPKPGARPSDAQVTIDDLAVDRWLETIPERQRAGILPSAKLKARALEIGQEHLAEDASISARARGGWEAAADVGGQIGGMMTDPLNIAGLAFGAPLSAGVLRTALTEGGVAMLTQAGIEAGTSSYRKQLGLETGVGASLENIGLAGIGGAALGGAFKALPIAGRALVDGVHATAGRLLGAEVAPAFDHVQAFDDLMHANPFEPGAAGRAEHQARAQAVDEALMNGGALPEFAAAEGPALTPAGPDAAGNRIYQFDPASLSVDAHTYQFKAGSDAAGVTDRLQGVGAWDPVRAGLTVIHERSDGTRYIADGHQRLGLARRIAAEDPAQAPKLTGFLLREADGVTVEDARVIAALKNIAEGTGSPLDAAKVLRARPDAGLDLPPTSALVRDAQGLAHLSDDAFGMVVNGVVPERFAALLGKIASDQPELHAEVLKILAREKPETAVEAESMIRDALSAPAVREVQTDMFGSAAASQILYKERAQVLAGASRRLAQDKQAFSLLVRERSRIEEAGNVLATDVNVQRASENAQTLDALQKLARRKGPIADALARAAEALRSGERATDVVGRFISDVRRAAEDELGAGGHVGGAGRGREDPAHQGGLSLGDERLPAKFDVSSGTDGSIHAANEIRGYVRDVVLPTKGAKTDIRFMFDLGTLPDAVAAATHAIRPDWAEIPATTQISNQVLLKLFRKNPGEADVLLTELPKLLERPAEVLPDHAHPERVIFARPLPEANAVAVVEAARTRQGLEIVSIHKSPDRTLKKARAGLAEVLNKGGGDGAGGAAAPSYGRQPEGAPAAADFPTISAVEGNIGRAEPDGKVAVVARDGLQAKAEEAAARFDKVGGEGTVSQSRGLATDLSRAIDKEGDFEVGLEFDGAGGVRTQSAKALLEEHIADQEFLSALKVCLK